ncbi:tyrosine-protein kinase [Pseudoxanthomonas yeongjuensis]|uniref:polysaccharide biosynthesis tyrosine autokinase n=1 Tax=Pseudoxanthomonas yeongjuensis TaxID=377616 RepID=UPI0013918CB2|nr:polysaccharide biosynthesis tyrosine autokinase [Pseudoxanthomonas yeongjuensis]KAF1715230.1 tyrosine-protein kinase [Pseudoxanthomonas yeongjuensis]
MATHLTNRTETHGQAPATLRDEDIDLPTMVGTLAENKRLILFGTALFLLVSAIYVLLVTPKYEANAVVQVENRMPTVPGLNANTAAQAPAPMSSPASTEVQLLTSRRVLGEALNNLDLYIEAAPSRIPLIGGIVARGFQLARPGELAAPWFGLDHYGWGGERIDVARLDVPANLVGVPLMLVAGDAGRYKVSDSEGRLLVEGSVGRVVDANGIKLEVKSLQANPGARFELKRLDPTTLIETLKRNISVSEQGRNSGVIALTYADADPVRARQVLDEITGSYVRQNVARTSAEAAKRLEFVTEQLPNVRRELAKAQAALNSFQSRTQTLDVDVQNRALLDQTIALDSGIQQLRIQMTDSNARFTPEHPVYRALQAQIGQFQREKAALQGRIQKLPDTQQGLFRLNRDVEVTNQTYANLLDQAQQLNIARASAVGNARVIDPAAVNLDDPAWPKPIPVLVGGTALGAILMIAFVLLRQIFKRGVEDPMDIELLGLPVYASIPYSEKGRALTLHPGRRFGRDGRQRLLALKAPTDLAMEALRTLRTSLHFARLKTRNNLLMITAPSPGVGKTFVCANLAVAMAQADQRVILVDADMRRGTLHNAVGVRWEGGLSELITGQIELDEAIRKVSGADNLSFISRGAVPPNPSELLMHENFSELLRKLADRYDIVVIDTPPILAVTDAAVIGHHVGTSLIVVRWGLNQQREIALAKQRLEQNGVEVKGAIFNGVQKRGRGQYAYTYYEYIPANGPRS